MKEVIEFLKESEIQYFATIGIDLKPKVRPFQYQFEKEGKIWYCTSNKKKVFLEITQNSTIELCACNKKMDWLRLSGEVVFSNNNDIKDNIIKNNALVREIYKSADNPDFEVFYLNNVKASISGFDRETIEFEY